MRKDRVNLAARFAVASELCRRIYSNEITLSYKERGHLELKGANGSIQLRVNGKQGDVWPACRGIYGKEDILILVHFANKSDVERPDFFLLTESEWQQVVKERIEPLCKKGNRIEVDSHNVAVNWSNLNDRGEPYKGIDVRPSAIQKHLEKWGKIVEALRSRDEGSEQSGS